MKKLFKFLTNTFKTTKCKVIIPPKNNKQTIEKGSKERPNDICMPFKNKIGNNSMNLWIFFKNSHSSPNTILP